MSADGAMGRIDVVTASAGTGKTYRLETEVRDAIASGATGPEQVVAVTFTRAAARDLVERVRGRLFKDGHRAEAQRLLASRIGTVHGVFGGMLADLALEAGRSPRADVVAERQARALFRIAADAAIGRHAPVLNRLAARFGFAEGLPEFQRDWRAMAQGIVDLARQNGLDAAALRASAQRSWEELEKVLQPASGDGAALDAELASEARKALAAMPGTDRTGASEDARETLRKAVDGGELPWSDWARIAKLKPGAQSKAAVKPASDVAARHATHPRLRADLEAFIRAIFACAADSLEAWTRYKAERGLVDFADQEAAARDMLDLPSVQERLREEARLLLVDEFQDTSPMQLALFLRAARLVPRSLWVGDPKQAIYGFRGTDPALMRDVAAVLATRHGGEPQTLSDMYRSRRGLVAFCNDVFGDAFAACGIARGQVEVRAMREDDAGMPCPLLVWRLAGSNKEKRAAALAAAVAAMLRASEEWMVPGRRGAPPAKLRGGDVALLCRSNANAAMLAAALAAAGLKVALGREGLLQRAECALALAGLRLVADRGDSAALAELAHLLAGGGEAPGWLADALGAEDPAGAIARHVGAAERLAELRARLEALSPAEALDATIAALDLPQLLRAWGDGAARLANLEALRGLARGYQDECAQDGAPATAAGLCAWLAAEEQEEPASPDPDAVQVATVHGSKGREWPVVVVCDLDQEPRGRLFDKPVAMARADRGLDPDDPLAGRWIRLWPWPYGAQKKDVGLDARAAANAIVAADARSALEEELRLLYVAMTRARDWLVLAPTLGKGGTMPTPWLATPGAQRIVLPAIGATGPQQVLVDGKPHACIVSDHAAIEAEGDGAQPGAGASILAPALPAWPLPRHAPRLVRPSELPPGVRPALAPVALGARLPFAGDADMAAVGEAVHGFLAADDPGRAHGEREAMARRLLASWRVAALAAPDVVVAADRLWAWLATRWPGCSWRSEVPVMQALGTRLLSGRIDLVVEHEGGLAILDHKTFPGGADAWPARAAQALPQLAAYAGALSAATGRKVTTLAIHLPVAGVVLPFDAGEGWSAPSLATTDAGARE